MSKVTEAIKGFLEASKNENNADLIARWSPAMETQVNVIEGPSATNEDGTPATDREGKPLRNVFQRDGIRYWPIRLPKKADSTPVWNDYQLKWPLDEFANAIGSTGWDGRAKESRWVGFDFDSIVGHAEGVGLDDQQLEEIKAKVAAIAFVEIRKSTGGKGLHLYVHVQGVKTQNHTEHARLAKIILEMISRNIDFDLLRQGDKKVVDCCGGNMWIWACKMTADGLSLIKPATRTLTQDDLPAGWLERIKSEPLAERPTNINGAGSDWFAKAMQYILEWGQASHGERNSMSFRLAGHLAALPDDNGELPNEEQVNQVMRTWNCGNTPPLDDSELRSCVAGGINRGTPREKKGDQDEPKPRINIDHELHRMVDEASSAIGHAPNTYQYGQALVQVVYDAEKPPQCLHDNGSPQLRVIESPTLAARLSACADWWKFDTRAKKDVKKWKRTTPPPAVISAVHVAGNWPGVPPITGIVSCPVLRADGTILAEPGYDRETGLYLENGESYPSLMRPDEAIKLLHDVVCDFPFQTPEHRSAWLAFLVTMVTRPAFAGNAPFFLFEANAPGTGKGLLTDVTTMIVEGRVACRYSWSSDNEEIRKLITTIGMSGASYAMFDNIKGTLGGAALEQMMTAGIWADRVLGGNRQVSFPIRFIPAGTSNNAKLSHDMIRRTCLCKQHAPMENPAERTGSGRDAGRSQGTGRR